MENGKITLPVEGVFTSVTRDKGLFTGGFCGLRRATKRVAKRADREKRAD